MQAYLNLGCGTRFHPDWINMDMTANAPHVREHDLAKVIPLPDGSCVVVYHAALLEHMRCTDAPAFLQDCRRVLELGGIIRVGVPVLEQLCRIYLNKLEMAVAGDENASHDYDWILLELYDQTVREQRGGRMVEYLRQQPLPNEAFVYARIGQEGRELVRALRRQSATSLSLERSLPRRVYRRIAALPTAIKRRMLGLLISKKSLRAFAIGRFRLSGEVHHWMYDRFSLARLLLSVGFADPVVQTADSSMIPNWNDFHLDTLPDGTAIKPDLLFMEALKPRGKDRNPAPTCTPAAC